MADGGESSEHLISNPPSTTYTDDLNESLKSWCKEGFKHFDAVLLNLYKTEAIHEPMVRVLVFNIMGGYINNFSRAFEMNTDIMTSHNIAFAEMVQDPTVSKFVQSFMSDMVTTNIEKVID